MKPITYSLLFILSILYSPYIYSTTLFIINNSSESHSFCLEYRIDQMYKNNTGTQSAFVPFGSDHHSFSSLYPNKRTTLFIKDKKPSHFLFTFLSNNLKHLKPSVKRINGTLTLYKNNQSHEFTCTSDTYTNIILSLDDNGITVHYT